MKKVLLLSLLTIVLVVSCQTNEEVVPNQETKIKSDIQLQQRTQGSASDSDLDPTTHDDVGLEYADDSSSATSSVTYKYTLVKVVYNSNVTEAQKKSLMDHFIINNLNGWEYFYSEKCATKPNIEFWSLRIDKTKFIDKATNDPVKAINDYLEGQFTTTAGDGENADPEDVQCSESDTKSKEKVCLE